MRTFPEISTSIRRASTAMPAASSRRRCSATSAISPSSFINPSPRKSCLPRRRRSSPVRRHRSDPRPARARRTSARAAIDALPERIADDVYRCGYASESSFGAISYFLDDPKILIDSPRFAGPLVKKLANAGGVRRMLLTHQDDVADHEKFHERFGCDRVLHRDDVRSHTSMMEVQPTGVEPIELADDLVMIPTPGHTRGHAVFLYQ